MHRVLDHVLPCNKDITQIGGWGKSVLTLFRARIGWAWYRTKSTRKVTWGTLESTTRSQENGDACACQDRLEEVSVMGIYNQFFLPEASWSVLCLVLPSHPECEIRGVPRITESPMTLLFSLALSFWVVCLFLECSFASWLPPSFCCLTLIKKLLKKRHSFLRNAVGIVILCQSSFWKHFPI